MKTLSAFSLVQVAIASVLLAFYAWSLSLPAFTCADGVVGDSGLMVLLAGWIGVIFLDFRWLANISFAAMLVLPFVIGRRQIGFVAFAALVLPVLTSYLAWQSWRWPSPAGCGGTAGTPTGSLSLGDGGIMWVNVLFVTSAVFSVRTIVSPFMRAANNSLKNDAAEPRTLG